MSKEHAADHEPQSAATPIATRTRAQSALDAAQALRESGTPNERVTRDDTAEELPGKAEANRARVAFLSIKGATMQGWLEHCEGEKDHK